MFRQFWYLWPIRNSQIPLYSLSLRPGSSSPSFIPPRSSAHFRTGRRRGNVFQLPNRPHCSSVVFAQPFIPPRKVEFLLWFHFRHLPIPVMSTEVFSPDWHIRFATIPIVAGFRSVHLLALPSMLLIYHPLITASSESHAARLSYLSEVRPLYPRFLASLRPLSYTTYDIDNHILLLGAEMSFRCFPHEPVYIDRLV